MINQCLKINTNNLITIHLSKIEKYFKKMNVLTNLLFMNNQTSIKVSIVGGINDKIGHLVLPMPYFVMKCILYLV